MAVARVEHPVPSEKVGVPVTMREVWEKGPLHRQGRDRACQSWGASHLDTRWDDLEAGLLHKCWTWPCCSLAGLLSMPCHLALSTGLGRMPSRMTTRKTLFELAEPSGQFWNGYGIRDVHNVYSISLQTISIWLGQRRHPLTPPEHMCLRKTLSAEIQDFRLLLLEAVGKQTLQS